MKSTTTALEAIADRIDAGDLTTRVLRTYPFEEVPAALDALRTRDRAPGEIVLSGRKGDVVDLHGLAELLHRRRFGAQRDRGLSALAGCARRWDGV